AGPGGTAAAETAALLGRKVAVVEATPLVGGAAVNTGTIPSKTLRETALALSGVRSRALHGVDLSLRRGLTVNDLLRHERAVKATEATQMRARLDAYGVSVFHGTGDFHDAHTVRVRRPTPPGGEVYLRGDKVLVATGSSPARPALFPFQSNRVHDSDELLFISALPRSLAVVGAGVIGSEYACMFAALGARVHLIDGRDKLLPFLDPDLSAALEAAMTAAGIRFWWNEKVAKCDTPRIGETTLTLTSGAELQVDQVLVCAGRTSRAAELNPGAAGFELTPKGLIAVDEHFRTTVPHVYAVGDVIGFPALASTSAEQGRVAACHMFGSDAKAAVAKFLPAGIYTIPEVSAAGMTEAEAVAKGHAVVVGRAEYAQNPRGKIIGDKSGFLKLVFDAADMKLLGVHVIGEQACEQVHIGLLALMAGGGAKLFLDTCFNYPTLGDLYKLATHDALIRRAQEDGRIPRAVVG
ncbi:MAG TPA: Si-specific NAD(P)(+) transhydrogenase, partial [Urbifossiella sp.]|nr:Si-specific NAD(P)(+) transhydrogenase [Urbifossiella sp.]